MLLLSYSLYGVYNFALQTIRALFGTFSFALLHLGGSRPANVRREKPSGRKRSDTRVPPYLHHGEQAELHRVLRFSEEVLLIFLLRFPEVPEKKNVDSSAGPD